MGVKGSEPDERLSFELAPWPALLCLLRLAKESLGTIDFLHDNDCWPLVVGGAATDEEAMELAPWLLVLLAQLIEPEDEADESDSCVEVLLLIKLGVALSLEGAGLGWR